MMNFKHILVALMAALPCVAAAQLRFDAPISSAPEASQWSNKGSKVQCILSFVINDFGRADFTVLSGSEHQYNFELVPIQSIRRPSLMRFIDAPNDWSSSGDERVIGRIRLYEGFNPYVGNSVSLRMLSSLRKGHKILMPFTDEHSLPGETIVPTISSLGFNKAFQEFQTCTSGLITTSYRDIALMALVFEDNESVLIPNFQHQLNRQIEYIQNDEAVNRITIRTFAYGHVDDEENMALAKERADALIKQYVDAGISPDIIETEFSYHNTLSPRTEVKTSDLDSRKAIVELSRDEYKVRRDHEIRMPDVGLLEDDLPPEQARVNYVGR